MEMGEFKGQEKADILRAAYVDMDMRTPTMAERQAGMIFNCFTAWRIQPTVL